MNQLFLYSFGQNGFAQPKPKSLCSIIWMNFEDRVNQILLVAAVVSSIIGYFREGFPSGLIDGVSICMALTIIIVVGSANGYFSERKLQELMELSDEQSVTVIRMGQHGTISSEDLVVGDVYEIQAGMRVPADSLVIQGQDITVDQSELTGESEEVERQVVTPENAQYGTCGALLARSIVKTGFGRAIVTGVGINTEAGLIAQSAIRPDEQTPLQERLEDLVTYLSNIGFMVAGLTALFGFTRIGLEMAGILPCGCQNIFDCKHVPDCKPLKFDFDIRNRLWSDILDSFVVGIALVVMAIPEGLPLAVTISLSISSRQMLKRQNLVRKLDSCETMGEVTYICSDKTGTLTLNKMTVMGLQTLDKMFQAGKIYNETFQDQVKEVFKTKLAGSDESITDLMLESTLWNSQARIERTTSAANMLHSPYSFEVTGSATDTGLINFLTDLISPMECYTKQNELEDHLKLYEQPFNSRTKKAVIAIRKPDFVRVYCKGASELVLQHCEHIINQAGEIDSLDSKCQGQVVGKISSSNEQDGLTNRLMVDKSIEYFARKALRTILYAYKDISYQEFEDIKNNSEALEAGLTVLGLFALMDPLKSKISSSIKTVRKAHLNVIMCTGDNLETAKAIAMQAGIIPRMNSELEMSGSELSWTQNFEQKYMCMTGAQFRHEVGGLITVPDDSSDAGEDKELVRDMDKFLQIIPHLKVLARASPSDKYLLTTGLRNAGEVVAVTGDGTNDAPALKKANVGFAMNQTGTDIAKGSSDIILLDDDFSSIVVALMYGRNVYDNVRKFIQFQMQVCIVAMGIVFVGSVLLKDSPLNAVQMLWVNLIIDTLGALALATEPPLPKILLRKPQPVNTPIITPEMWRNVIGHSVYQLAVLTLVIFFCSANNWLIYEYSQPCIKYDAKQQCQVFNPFYTNELYYTQTELDLWLQRYEAKQFDPVLLKAYGEPPIFDGPTEKLEHYTIIFNCFVMMQIFNQVNARKLEADEFNVFANFCNNPIFFIIVLFTFFVQLFMIEIGEKAIQTVPLDFNQQLICIGFGVFELFFALIVKLLPLRWFKGKEIESVREDSIMRSPAVRKMLRPRALSQCSRLSSNHSNTSMGGISPRMSTRLARKSDLERGTSASMRQSSSKKLTAKNY